MKKININYIDWLFTNPIYGYAIIDPPWDFNDKNRPAYIENQITYKRWNNKDIELVFKNLVVDYLFLWVPNALLKDVLRSEHFDYEYKTVITWKKLTCKGNVFYGLENHFRNSTEQLLYFCKKGKPTLRSSMRNIIEESVGKRTVKPKIFESNLIKFLERERNLNGCYLFSGDFLNLFKEYDINCIDIIF